jgi:iron complex outermembrane receptor protein
MFKKTQICKGLILAFGGSAAVLALPALAQQQTQQAPASTQRVEVTGSNIKRTTSESATPIQVISRDDIAKSGATSLSEILQNVSAAGFGNFSETNTNLSSGGGSAGVSLRGLGLSYTLVLIDGRRVAPSGFGGATGVATFTDVNNIPPSAIERIEVLKGSASAVYGADAVGGVVNIILRREMKGGEITGQFAETSRGDGRTVKGSVAYGFGDLAENKFNVIASLDLYKRERIASVDRKYGASANGTLLNEELGVDSRSPTGNPGTFAVGTLAAGSGSALSRFTASGPLRAMPNCPESDKSVANPGATEDQYCLFNFLKFWDLVPPSERTNALVKATLEISPSLSAFGRLMLSENKTTFNVAPTPLPQGVIAADAPGNSLGQAYTYLYRITAGGPRVNEQKIDFQSAVLGLQGQVQGYDWEVALNSSRNKNRNDGSGYANTLKIAEQSALGNLRPYEFALNPALEADIAQKISASYTRIGKAQSDAVDAKITGELVQLPAGPMSFAAGIEFRRESISDACITPECFAGAGGTSVITGANSTKAGGKRDVNSQFVELRAPALKGLDLSFALRRDAYSGESTPDAGGIALSGKYDKVVPQLGVEFRPSSTMLLRGVIGQGFKAPTLFEAYQATSESFNSGAAWRDQRRYPVTGSVQDSGATQVKNFRGGQPALKPEESENLSLGIVLEPMPDMSVAVDVWGINLKQTIGLPSVSRLLARERVNGGDPLVTRLPASAADQALGIPGRIEYITLTYANLGSTRIRGADLDLEYRLRTASMGRFAFRTTMTHLTSYEQSPEPGVALVEYAGTYELPRFQANSSVKWAQGPWEALWTWRHVGNHLQDLQATGQDKVGTENYHDISVTYTGIKNLTVTGGIRNIMDHQPAFANGDSQNYSYVFGDPRGRSFWLSASYKF